MNAQRTYVVSTAKDMRDLGARLGEACAGGDVVILSGDLGAGKTTIAQGIGRGLGIDEAVTSPTFVIARVHVNPGEGPDLVHVDAYRLGSLAEVEDLDLESDLANSVVVVEWGDGMVEALGDSRVVVRISRTDDYGDETRIVAVSGAGDRWTATVDGLAWSAP